MSRRLRSGAGMTGVLAGSLWLHISQGQSQFRSGVDAIRLDVSVLDKTHRPVTGLRASDFRVLEDGKPQQIVAVNPIEVAPAAVETAAWMRTTSPDLSSNDLSSRRIFVIVRANSKLVSCSAAGFDQPPGRRPGCAIEPLFVSRQRA